VISFHLLAGGYDGTAATIFVLFYNIKGNGVNEKWVRRVDRELSEPRFTKSRNQRYERLLAFPGYECLLAFPGL